MMIKTLKQFIHDCLALHLPTDNYISFLITTGLNDSTIKSPSG